MAKISRGYLLFREGDARSAPRARKRFGYPRVSSMGKQFMGLFQESMILRLPTDRARNLESLQREIFEPMLGRPMREVRGGPAIVDCVNRRETCCNGWGDLRIRELRSKPTPRRGQPKEKPSEAEKSEGTLKKACRSRT